MKAYELIEKTGWTQGAYARDEYGNTVLYTDPKAVCFCAMGAIRKVYEFEEAFAPVQKLARVVGPVSDWNDNCTREEVIAELRELDI
jgi:hypothetical protein